MTANVTIVVDEREDALVVSNKALRYRPADAASSGRDRGSWRERARGGGDRDGGGRDGRGRRNDETQPGRRGMVWVLRDGKPTPVRIRIGLSDGTNTEILAGELGEGDLVITAAAAGERAASGPGQAGSRGQRGGRRGPPSIL
jgi:HlyD family secretion protein